MDCYILVTRMRHPMPCPPCRDALYLAAPHPLTPTYPDA
jgi:hypothetical protein